MFHFSKFPYYLHEIATDVVQYEHACIASGTDVSVPYTYYEFIGDRCYAWICIPSSCYLQLYMSNASAVRYQFTHTYMILQYIYLFIVNVVAVGVVYGWFIYFINSQSRKTFSARVR